MIKLDDIRRHAAVRPDAIAVVDGATRLSWTELADAVERVAAGLVGRLPEVSPARAVFLAGPSRELTVALAACATLGIPCTGLDPAQEPDRLDAVLALLDPCAVFLTAEHRPLLEERAWPGGPGALRILLDATAADEAGPQGPARPARGGPEDQGAAGAAGRPDGQGRTAGGAEHTHTPAEGEREAVPGVDGQEHVRGAARSAQASGAPDTALPFCRLLDSEPLKRLPEPLHREFLSVVPGGRRPRITVRRAAAEGRGLIDLVDEFGFDAHDTHLVAAPLWMPLSLQLARTLLAVGATVVLDATQDAQTVAALVTAERVTTAVIDPGALGRLLAHPASAPLAHTGRLRCVITPGRHVGRWTVNTAWERLGPVLHLAHTTPETGLSAILTPEESQVARARTGRALLGTTVTVLDEDGAVLPAGRPGRVAVAGHHVMDDYLEDPGGPEAEDAFVTLDAGAGQQRFFVTDDLGVLDEQGRLTVTGRGSGVTSPARDRALDAALFRLESDLLNLPCLRDTAVVRVSLPSLGDALVVPFIAVAVGRETTGYTALRTACARRVPSIPAHVIAVDHIPYSPTGRIRTAELLEAVVPIITLNLQLEQSVQQEISA
ncbi:class I adenylate-forming enzyme family protein [Streptomyces sp. NPDC006335]|uniref:class I adenylate-forming enzyme family protein n=1 Tax=Streptomyces sp. NPDC006335 TaxID=3156895 RepID=UPI0033A8A213